MTKRSTLALLFVTACGSPPVDEVADVADAGPFDAGHSDGGAGTRDAGPAPCLPDRLEPNDLSRPSTLWANVDYPDLTACPDEDDFYLIAMYSSESYAIDAFYDSADGMLSMALFNRYGPIPVATATIAPDGVTLRYPAGRGGNHWLQVRRADPGRAPLPYFLAIKGLQIPNREDGRCEDDEYPTVSTDCVPTVVPPLHNGGESVVEGCGSLLTGWHATAQPNVVWTYGTCCAIAGPDHKERTEWAVQIRKPGHYDLHALLPSWGSACSSFDTAHYTKAATYGIRTAAGEVRFVVDQQRAAAFGRALVFADWELPVGTATVVLYDTIDELPQCDPDPATCWRCSAANCFPVFAGPLEATWVRP